VGVADENVGYARVFMRKYWGTQPMFRRSEFSPVISASLRQIDGRLRELERHLERVGSRTSSQAAFAAEGIGEAVASTLSTMADRLRDGATSVGSEAAKFGNDAVRRLAREVEDRPLVLLAVAVGVGILVGLSIPRHSSMH
jgi:ElaB/YqjD/DUF883 family membrane-anchored ribosome-binding protein